MTAFSQRLLLAAVLALTSACGRTEGAVPAMATGSGEVAELRESFLTPRDTLDNIDSPAVWHGPDGQHWLMATGKTTDVLVVSDAATGAPIRRVGRSGPGLGKLERPNGIAVVDDLVMVVERDNHRVQVFRLPEFAPLGSFGDSLLRLPYGVAVHREGAGRYVVYVTDNYGLADDAVPPDSLLGERVREFRVGVAGGTLKAEPVRAFGATSGPGVLRVVESIAVDASNGRLLVAEELEGGSQIKVYSLAGEFTGRVIDGGLFSHQAEGIILYACGDAGYWVTTDQAMAVNTFHVFDRKTLAHTGSFRGETTLNTDGIALTQQSYGGFPNGAFFAVHDDGSVAAFSWAEIAEALGIRRDCPA